MDRLVEVFTGIALGLVNPYSAAIIALFTLLGVAAYNVRLWYGVFKPFRLWLALRALVLGLALCIIISSVQVLAKEEFAAIGVSVATSMGKLTVFSARYTLGDVVKAVVEVIASKISGGKIRAFDPGSVLLYSVAEDLAIATTIAVLCVLALLLALSPVIGLIALFRPRSSTPMLLARVYPVFFIVWAAVSSIAIPSYALIEAKKALLTRYSFAYLISLPEEIRTLILRYAENVISISIDLNIQTAVAVIAVAAIVLLTVFTATRGLRAREIHSYSEA